MGEREGEKGDEKGEIFGAKLQGQPLREDGVGAQRKRGFCRGVEQGKLRRVMIM